MTDDPLAPALKPWLRQADGAIDQRFAAARVHAVDGDLASAARWLGDVRTRIAGPGGLLERARRDAFRLAFEYHLQSLDPEIRRDDVGPRRDLEDVAAAARIMGRDDSADLGNMLSVAGKGLAVAHGAYPVWDPEVRHLRVARFRTWEIQHSGAARAWARRTLSNHQVYVHHQVGLFCVKPELRD